jgi:hypothetical protein
VRRQAGWRKIGYLRAPMAFSDQRLYRARAFEPVAGIHEIVLVTDQSGPIQKYFSGGWFQVAGVRPVIFSQNHGVFTVWTQGSVASTYALPTGCPTGSIAASGGKATFPNPVGLQLGPKQAVQARFAIRPLALTGPTVDEIDVQVFNPSGIATFGTMNLSPGFLNMVDQVPMPSDVTVEPAAAATMTQQTSPPALHPRDQANLSELFWFEYNAPTIVVINESTSAASAGSVALRIWAFLYDLVPVGDSPALFEPRLMFGRMGRAPKGWQGTTLPTAPYMAAAGF